MPEKPKIKQYRIGEYAQKMGVTPDLLKHYEKMDLIHAQTTDSGYRYYSFPESVPLLECLTLRNYGVPLQKMRDLIYAGTAEEFRQTLEDRAREIQCRAVQDQALLREYADFDAWMRRMEHRDIYMLLEEQGDMYFLPHSKRHDFLEDDRIQALLPQWTEWMPLVKSCRKIAYQPGDDCLREAIWGLAAPADKADACGLPLNDAVERLPGGRKLVCHYRMEITPDRPLNTVWTRIQEQIAQSSLMPSGPILQTVLLSLFSPENRMGCGYFSIPI